MVNMSPVDLIMQWAEDQGFGVRRMDKSYISSHGMWIEIWDKSVEGLLTSGRKQVRLVVFGTGEDPLLDSNDGSKLVPLDVLIKTKIPVIWNLAEPHFFDKLGERIRYEWDVILKNQIYSYDKGAL